MVDNVSELLNQVVKG